VKFIDRQEMMSTKGSDAALSWLPMLRNHPLEVEKMHVNIVMKTHGLSGTFTGMKGNYIDTVCPQSAKKCPQTETGCLERC
jgi:hypothetical protein